MFVHIRNQQDNCLLKASAFLFSEELLRLHSRVIKKKLSCKLMIPLGIQTLSFSNDNLSIIVNTCPTTLRECINTQL